MTTRASPAPAIAVFCSGRGTNLQAILNATRRGTLRARVALVISDRANANALARAKKAGVCTLFIDPKAFPSKEAYERMLIQQCQEAGAQVICLAGFMRILSPVFVKHFRHRILNIHPALLPAFPGAHAVADALAWGVHVTGVTVHLVDEQVDHGPILLQEAVTIDSNETEDHLLTRIHAVEHRLYPKAIALLLAGRIKIHGRRLRVAS